MKKLVWSERVVEGGARVAGPLPAPPSVSGTFQNIAAPNTSLSGASFTVPSMYRDAAVVAYRMPAAESEAQAVVTVTARIPALVFVGAAAGAIIGAGTGAAIAAQGEPRPGGYRYYNNGCYIEQPGGWVAVSPRYCGAQVQYAPPPPRYYDDTPRCMRSPTYNPRRGTFIGRDGYERPCP